VLSTKIKKKRRVIYSPFLKYMKGNTMGYYTKYDVKITGFDNAKQAVEGTKEYLGYYDISENGTEITASFEDKWYDWKKDSVALTQMYPRILIEISGEGEESEDFWKARIKNGQCEIVQAKIVFPDFKVIK